MKNNEVSSTPSHHPTTNSAPTLSEIPILSLNDEVISSSSPTNNSSSQQALNYSSSSHSSLSLPSSNQQHDGGKNSKNEIMSNLYIPSSGRSEWDEYSITQSPAFIVLKEMFYDSLEDDEVPKSVSLESFTECVEMDDSNSDTNTNNNNIMVDCENSQNVENAPTAVRLQNAELTSPTRKQSICESPRNTHRNSIISLPICKEIEPKDIKLNILHLKKKARHIRILLVRHGQCVTNVHKTILQEKSDHSIPLSKAGEEQAKAAGVYIKRFYEDMNRRLWEKIQKENLKYTDISKKKFSRELKFVSNETTDFKFDNDLSEDEDESEKLESVTYPLRVRMWNSTYNRARETANIIMSEASNVIQDQRESILLVEQQFGLFEGVPLDELNKRFPQEFQHFEKHIGFFGRFYARPPLGESRFDVSKRVKLLFEKLISDSETEGINDIIIVSHGVTVRAFTQMWLDLKPEWFDAEVNPNNCGIRFLDGNRDRGYVFNGFSLHHHTPQQQQPKTSQ
ncbi:predicted protein [Naegleria gruberi]|uniref:Predicted protein n=1 Tax=Naegleria gruberi TaxID=5762 RepID=D2VGI4_NAEGR|nr:uncharacterized protein NAEGRDRAFT_67990 [Naegleria gruberi]EFC44070.1 predicted protein [Naegleria gruberi]|eukprot:XP_002676814.1 predicted protein [Naegleria gruberi strain NEG-M]